MNTLKTLGLVLVLVLGLSTAMSVVSGFAKPDEFGDCPECAAQPQQSVIYSVTFHETDNGTLQLIFYLDMNGNEQLDEGEPIVLVITIAQ